MDSLFATRMIRASRGPVLRTSCKISSEPRYRICKAPPRYSCAVKFRKNVTMRWSLHIRVPDDSVAGGRIEPVDAPLKIGDPVATRDALNEALKFRCVEKK